MNELQEKLRRRSILNGETAPTEGEVVTAHVHEVVKGDEEESIQQIELKKKLQRRSILNGEAVAENGEEIKRILREGDEFGPAEAIVISDELRDKLVQRRTANGEEDISDIAKEVEMFQLFRQVSAFDMNPMEAAAPAAGREKDVEEFDGVGRKLRLCEAILTRPDPNKKKGDEDKADEGDEKDEKEKKAAGGEEEQE